MFLARDGHMVPLTDDIWQRLENTDSNRFEAGDWKTVERFANSVQRNWLDLKKKLQACHSLDAPLVMYINGKYHLISGNTRLMVARAAGITPNVLLF